MDTKQIINKYLEAQEAFERAKIEALEEMQKRLEELVEDAKTSKGREAERVLAEEYLKMMGLEYCIQHRIKYSLPSWEEAA